VKLLLNAVLETKVKKYLCMQISDGEVTLEVCMISNFRPGVVEALAVLGCCVM